MLVISVLMCIRKLITNNFDPPVTAPAWDRCSAIATPSGFKMGTTTTATTDYDDDDEDDDERHVEDVLNVLSGQLQVRSNCYDQICLLVLRRDKPMLIPL